MKNSKSEGTRNRERLVRWLVPGLFATVGCGADFGGSPENSASGADETVATDQSAIVGCLPNIYSIYGGGPFGPKEDQICFMTEIEPTPTSAHPYDPDLIISHSSGYWYATGYGHVGCVPMSCFSGNGAPDQYLLSPMFQATADAESGKGYVSKHTDMWLADSMAFMSTYHYGQYSEGPNDSASAHQDTDPTKLNYLFASAQSLAGKPFSITTAMGYSFFVGAPHTAHAVKFSQSWYRNTTATLIPYSSGVCALSGVNLNVNGGSATLYNSPQGFWTLKVSGGAQVTCYPYDQT